ncbi:hypothetical protein YB2330_002354 [Saitoella coloradoensis]
MSMIRVAQTARQRAMTLMGAVNSHSSSCPCHSCSSVQNPIQVAKNILRKGYATPVSFAEEKEYAFEMAASSIRYGEGVTREVGMDFKNMGAKKVAVFTDKTIAQLTPLKLAIEGLEAQGVPYAIFDNVRVEPKDTSIKEAIEFARNAGVDSFLAVGGGSVMDTAKLANLYTCYPDADFMDFVNAPLGKGLPVDKRLHPLIAVPTTAGTGSETTGTAIFDLQSHKTKTGIAHRNLKPLLGVVDPLNVRTMPSAVFASSGLDVLCHSIESYTAIPYNERTPRPSNPLLRPAYQGANPISDIWSITALKMVVEYLPRCVKDPGDHFAQGQMLLAATFAGIGFGNAGVHLCHGMSYPLSGMNKNYKHAGYAVDHPIVPHGVSVAVTAPAVFNFTAPANPERHLEIAQIFGVDTSNARKEDAGPILSEAIAKFLVGLGDQPRGISQLGYERSDIPSLVEGTLPQRRVLMLAPEPEEVTRDSLAKLFEQALEY